MCHSVWIFVPKYTCRRGANSKSNFVCSSSLTDSLVMRKASLLRDKSSKDAEGQESEITIPEVNENRIIPMSSSILKLYLLVYQ